MPYLTKPDNLRYTVRVGKWNKSRIDHNQLKTEIRQMSVRSNLYKLLKAELTGLGYWKQKPRGNPEAGYRASHKDEKDF